MSINTTNTNANNNTNTETKKIKKGSFAYRILLCVGIYAGYAVVMALPHTLRTVILTAGVVGYLYPKFVSFSHRARGKGKEGVFGAKKFITRFSRVLNAVTKMSDEEFNSQFGAAEPNQTRNSESQSAD